MIFSKHSNSHLLNFVVFAINALRYFHTKGMNEVQEYKASDILFWINKDVNVKRFYNGIAEDKVEIPKQYHPRIL